MGPAGTAACLADVIKLEAVFRDFHVERVFTSPRDDYLLVETVNSADIPCCRWVCPSPSGTSQKMK